MSRAESQSTQSVVVSYLPSDVGDAALAAGIARAKLLEQSVVVVNASRGDALADPHFLTEAAAQELRERLAAEGVPGEVRQEIGADLADVVLDVAEEVDASTIVVGLRHRTPVGKLLLGSVSQRILLDSRVPVLAVKPAAAHG